MSWYLNLASLVSRHADICRRHDAALETASDFRIAALNQVTAFIQQLSSGNIVIDDSLKQEMEKIIGGDTSRLKQALSLYFADRLEEVSFGYDNKIALIHQEIQQRFQQENIVTSDDFRTEGITFTELRRHWQEVLHHTIIFMDALSSNGLSPIAKALEPAYQKLAQKLEKEFAIKAPQNTIANDNTPEPITSSGQFLDGIKAMSRYVGFSR